MSARALWIVALGAALAVMIALNVFRSQEQAGVGAIATSSFSAGGDEPAARRPAGAVRGSPSVAQRADAAGADGRGAPPEPQPVPPPFPTPGRYASISAALADQNVQPERRMPALPELLDTDRAFAAESVDPAWSTATEAGVLGRIAEIPGAAYVSLNVECRTTLCLLQFVESATPTPSSGIADIAKLVEPQGLKSLWMFGIRVRGGAPLGIAYFQRVEATQTPTGATERSVQ
jgi:hypothetical protein